MSPPDVSARCDAVVLAAGAATRFDGAKLLAPFRDRPLVSWSVEAALAAPVETVTVVLGSRADDVATTLDAITDSRLRTVTCSDWQTGLSASLRCGLKALPTDCRAALIFLGDMPNVDPGVAAKLLRAVLDGAPAALPEFAGMPGHPVAISGALFERLAALEGDRGARAVLEDIAGVVRIPVEDPGCIQDIDTKEDIDGLA